MTPPLIAIEEHYYSKAIFSSIGDHFQRTLQAVPNLVDRLLEIGDGRLEAMEHGGIATQVISHAFTPGGPSALSCRQGNVELAKTILETGHTRRFAGFAVLPVGDAAESATELDRAVTTHGFVGALIDNHANGKHFDSPAYDKLWAKACELDVPIYLHPTWPSSRMAEGFAGNFPSATSASLSAAGWGWHEDVGLHILKLFCANVFDRFPSLKIVIGHMGEMLPFMLERCCDMSTRWGNAWGSHERPFEKVWNENIWITTSGCWSLAPMRCILENTKVERILYSVDYSFESNESGRMWFQELERSGMLSSEQLEMVAHKNAESLLKLRAV